jgi:protein-tyrosine phosphatase
VIDLHCHILPGVDDGPETVEGSLDLARAAVASGAHTIVATPHVSWRWRNTSAGIATAAGALRERIALEGIDLELLAGAELAMTHAADVQDMEVTALHLGGGPWLLLEPPFATVASGLPEIAADLQRRGHRILLAHPERCPAIRREPRLLEELVASGALSSVTAGSLVGRFGESVRRMAQSILEAGLAHNVASDAHGVGKRAPGASREIEAAGLGPLAEWLTETVPAAILGGSETIPPRPSYTPPRRGLAGRLRPRRRRQIESP